MIYKLNEKNQYVPANIFDVQNYYYITELVFNNNVPANLYDFSKYDLLLFIKENPQYDEYRCITLNNKLMRANTIDMLKTIDTSDYFTTNYRIFNSEMTNTIFFKLYFCAIAFKYAELANISFTDALTKCTVSHIYDNYMQAEPAQDVALYIKTYM